MKEKIGKYIGYAALWAVVILIICLADRGSTQYRSTSEVCRLTVNVRGEGGFIDEASIEAWLDVHGAIPLGRIMSQVDVSHIESIVQCHSAVRDVNAYMTYDGKVVVNVSSRCPVARLRVDGYDMYVADDGFLMPATDGYVVPLPVITGDYKPIYGADFVGYHSVAVGDSIRSLERMIVELEKSKNQLLRERKKGKDRLQRILNQGVKRTIFMSSGEYNDRRDALKARKVLARKENAAREQEIAAELAGLENQQRNLRIEQKKLEKTIEDFSKLINFVEQLRNDPFWGAEVVQIELTGGGDTPLQVSFIPRSGSFVVDMGEVERMDEKLAMLTTFYDKALREVGWQRYRHISLRYRGQVVCR